MRKRKVSFLFAFLAMLCLSAAVFAACDDKTSQEPDTPPETQSSAAIAESEIRLELYETYRLDATISGGTAVWTTSDPAVATVTDGLVSGLSVGTVTVTLTVGEASDSCKVTVYDAGVVPTLSLNTNSVELETGNTFTLTVTALWKEDPVAEAVTYVWTEKSGAGVTSITDLGDGKFTVTALTAGEAVWTVSAEVRGTTVSENVTVNVVSPAPTLILGDKYVPTAGGYTTELQLSLTDTATTQPIDAEIYKGASQVTDAQLVWQTQDSSVADVSDGNIVAKGSGSTTLTATYEDVVFTITVTVIRQTLNMDESFTLERLDGTSAREVTLKEAPAGTPEKAYFANGENILQSADGSTLTLDAAGIPKTADQMGEDVAFTIETERAIYQYKVDLFTQIIDSANELKNFHTIGRSVYPDEELVAGGYFVLGEDIDFGGESFGLGSESAGFRGVFDGRGYIIKDITMSYTGLFGTVYDGSAIRNLTMIGVTNSQDWVSAVLVRDVSPKTAAVTIENIYIRFTLLNGCYREGAFNGILYGSATWSADASKITFRNVMIAVDLLERKESPVYVAGKVSQNAGLIQNVYVYGVKTGSKKGVRINYSDKNSIVRNDADVFGAYETREEMIAAGNDYTAFTSSDFWRLDDEGLPYPVRLPDAYTVRFVADDATVSETSVLSGDTLALPADPTKDGYAFDGWALGDQTTAYDFDAENAMVVTADMTFTALWAPSIESGIVSEAEVLASYTGTTYETVGNVTTASSFVIDISDVMSEIDGTLLSVRVDGQTYEEVSYEDGMITVTADLPISLFGQKSYVAQFEESDGRLYISGEILFVTMKIGSVADLSVWQSIGHLASGCSNHVNMQCVVDGYFVMESNIVCTGRVYTDTIVVNGASCATVFNGVFDGRGYNIDGYAGGEWHSFLYRLGTNGVVRNLSFTNIDRTQMIASLLVQDNWGDSNGLIENLYVHYSNFVANKYSLLVGGTARNNIAFRNILVRADQTSGDLAGSVINTSSVNEGLVKNVYAIGLGSLLVINASDSSAERNDVDVFAAYADDSAMIAAGNDYTAFTDSGYWRLDENGLPFPKYQFNVSFVANGTTVSKEMIREGGTLSVPEDPSKSGYAFAGWGFGDQGTAYDFTAPGAAVVSADMTFTALWVQSIESGVVSEAEVVTSYTGTDLQNDGSMTTATSFTIDVSDVQEKISGTLLSVRVDGQTYETVSYDSGIITVTADLAATMFGQKPYVALFEDDGQMMYVSGEILFITMKIGSEEDLRAFYRIGLAAYPDDAKRTGGYFVLDDNIQWTIDTAYSVSSDWIFQGTFDGRGYTIDGASFGATGLFNQVADGTVIKNFALTNVASHSSQWVAAVIAKDRVNATDSIVFENIYIHLKTLSNCVRTDANSFNGIIFCSASWSGAATGTVYRNIFIEADTVASGNYPTYVLGKNGVNAGQIQNVYVCCSGGSVAINVGDTETVRGDGEGDKDRFGLYESREDMLAAGNDYSSFTETEYWTYNDTDGLQFVSKN